MIENYKQRVTEFLVDVSLKYFRKGLTLCRLVNLLRFMMN